MWVFESNYLIYKLWVVDDLSRPFEHHNFYDPLIFLNIKADGPAYPTSKIDATIFLPSFIMTCVCVCLRAQCNEILKSVFA